MCTIHNYIDLQNQCIICNYITISNYIKSLSEYTTAYKTPKPERRQVVHFNRLKPWYSNIEQDSHQIENTSPVDSPTLLSAPLPSGTNLQLVEDADSEQNVFPAPQPGNLRMLHLKPVKAVDTHKGPIVADPCNIVMVKNNKHGTYSCWKGVM